MCDRYEILILKEGYSNICDGYQKADCSITIIRGTSIIIVDVGNPWDKEYIISKMKEFDILTNEINLVVCTHCHSDHVGNLNLFLNADKHIVGHDISCVDMFFEGPFIKNDNFKINETINIFSTPGHTDADISVTIKTIDKGNIIISGDIFEKLEDLNDPILWQRNSFDIDLQTLSRNKILKLADHIIPGHGPMFMVPVNVKRAIN
ncbi:unnamed protein product [Gordionus sp. m RMFG-2023]|uniref:metallo-beta-lactamase domain-containing protein 1-like n=1 Tax=Gordionus sp. m RMFG-2023 TaxID=3053472 RepID=UPI0030E4779F